MNILKVAMIQHSCDESRDLNIEKSARMITESAAAGAELVVLQELHASTYFCQTENPALFDHAETVPGPSTSVFGELAKKLGVVIVTSLFEKRAAGLYHNTSAIIDKNGSIAGIYRKMHIPDDPGFYEKFYFTPGDLGFMPVKTSIGMLGVMVCWDQWYPEAARLMALAGAEILIYPTAIGWDPSDTEEEQQRQYDAWLTVQRGHAIANGLPVVAVNRVGFEASVQDSKSGIKFWGGSFAAGPQGELLAQGASNREEVIMADIDMAKCEKTRRIWPFLRDRRIDAYGEIAVRFRD